MRPHSKGGSITTVLLLALLTLTSTVTASTTIVDLVTSDPGFSLLIRALQDTRLIPDLNKCQSCTFFAPTNAAFKQWREKQGNKPIDRKTLQYHILPKAYESQNLKDAMLLETSLVRPGYLGDNNEGQLVAVTKQSWRPGRRNRLLVGGSELIKMDWIADNGVVHVIDRFLVPPVDLGKRTRILFSLFPSVRMDEEIAGLSCEAMFQRLTFPFVHFSSFPLYCFFSLVFA